jgi:hypothetical protein
MLKIRQKAYLGLPAEIWRNIFRMATFIHNRFDTSLSTTIDQSGVEYDAEAWETHRTKDTLSRVCRAWRLVALEFLFEYLSMHPGKMHLNVDILDPPDGSPSVCRYVIILWNDRGLRSDNPAEPLLHIIPRCTSLRIYHDSFPLGPPPKVLLSTLFTHCGRTLQYFRSSSVDLPKNFARLLANAAPQIEYLHFGGAEPEYLEIDPNKRSGVRITFPALHTLVLYPFELERNLLYDISTWHFPALRQLVIARAEASPESASFIQKILPSAEITTLDVGTCRRLPIEFMLHRYPKLEELCLASSTQWSLPRAVFPSVTCVIIVFELDEDLQPQWQTDTIDRLLNDLPTCFPKLKHVRIDNLQRDFHQWFMRWQLNMLQCDVQFEGREAGARNDGNVYKEENGTDFLYYHTDGSVEGG